MPIPEGLTPTRRHRVLLQHGDREGWWTYESENPEGYTDPAGITYAGLTYTVRLPQADEDAPPRILLADEVDGFVLATAEQYGPDAVTAIAYRDGLP